MGKYAVYDSHERDYPFSSDSYKDSCPERDSYRLQRKDD